MPSSNEVSSVTALYITPGIDERRVLQEGEHKKVPVHYHRYGERCNARCVQNG